MVEVISRKTGKKFKEQTFGEKFLHFAYDKKIGRKITSSAFLQKQISEIYGAYAHSPFSKREIPRFIKNYGIDMDEFVDEEYRCFNDFFIRPFKKEARSFPKEKHHLGAIAEGRMSVFKIEHGQQSLVVKGEKCSLAILIGGHLDSHFVNGWAYVSRLCPVDYHRFHYPDEGEVLGISSVSGKLESVHPISLQQNNRIFLENKRDVSFFESKNLGRLAFIEVGAMCVGEINQLTNKGERIKRGETKGIFSFGGSTCILLTEKKILPDQDLLENTGKGFETLVRLGEKIGSG